MSYFPHYSAPLLPGYVTTSDDQIVSVVDTAELAAWLVVDDDDPLLHRMVATATSQVIEYLQSELVTRSRVVTYQDWPYVGTETVPSIARQAVEMQRDIWLPYAQLSAVDSVEVYGEETTDYTVNATRIASIRLPVDYQLVHGVPAIVVRYTAGYGPQPGDVPDPIRTGALMLAAFLYEHRGACDAHDAIKRSGAGQHLYPYRLQAVVL